MISTVLKELTKIANPKNAKILSKFFQTGKGNYGEGDVFLGIKIPEQRAIGKKYMESLTADDHPKTGLVHLLKDDRHEVRCTGLLILVEKYKKTKKDEEKEKYFNFYLANTKFINNWDLVDLSCYHIVGDYLLNPSRSRDILYTLAKSESMWEQRISIVSTLAFLRKLQFDDTVKLAEYFVKKANGTHEGKNDKQDKSDQPNEAPGIHHLIEKATGWMLREMGNKNRKVEEDFLNKYHKIMPRIMLRYSIEKFPPEMKKKYMGNGRPTKVKADKVEEEEEDEEDKAVEPAKRTLRKRKLVPSKETKEEESDDDFKPKKNLRSKRA